MRLLRMPIYFYLAPLLASCRAQNHFPGRQLIDRDTLAAGLLEELACYPLRIQSRPRIRPNVTLLTARSTRALCMAVEKRRSSSPYHALCEAESDTLSLILKSRCHAGSDFPKEQANGQSDSKRS